MALSESGFTHFITFFFIRPIRPFAATEKDNRESETSERITLRMKFLWKRAPFDFMSHYECTLHSILKATFFHHFIHSSAIKTTLASGVSEFEWFWHFSIIKLINFYGCFQGLFHSKLCSHSHKINYFIFCSSHRFHKILIRLEKRTATKGSNIKHQFHCYRYFCLCVFVFAFKQRKSMKLKQTFYFHQHVQLLI